MADLLRLIIDVASLLFPFRLVHTWERGLFFVFGRGINRPLPPGLYPVVPWFTDVRPVSVVPSVHQTPVQTIGRLTFATSLVLRVFDPWLAYTTLEAWSESSVELASAVVASHLRSGVDPDDAHLTALVNAELQPFGVECLRLRLTDLVTDSPVLRLLTSYPEQIHAARV